MSILFTEYFLWKTLDFPRVHMASNGRKAMTVEEKELLKASEKGDVEKLTSLLQKGVFPNVYDKYVWLQSFSSLGLLKILSVWCKFLICCCLWMTVMRPYSFTHSLVLSPLLSVIWQFLTVS